MMKKSRAYAFIHLPDETKIRWRWKLKSWGKWVEMEISIEPTGGNFLPFIDIRIEPVEGKWKFFVSRFCFLGKSGWRERESRGKWAERENFPPFCIW